MLLNLGYWFCLYFLILFFIPWATSLPFKDVSKNSLWKMPTNTPLEQRKKEKSLSQSLTLNRSESQSGRSEGLSSRWCRSWNCRIEQRPMLGNSQAIIWSTFSAFLYPIYGKSIFHEQKPNLSSIVSPLNSHFVNPIAFRKGFKSV